MPCLWKALLQSPQLTPGLEPFSSLCARPSPCRTGPYFHCFDALFCFLVLVFVDLGWCCRAVRASSFSRASCGLEPGAREAGSLPSTLDMQEGCCEKLRRSSSWLYGSMLAHSGNETQAHAASKGDCGDWTSSCGRRGGRGSVHILGL